MCIHVRLCLAGDARKCTQTSACVNVKTLYDTSNYLFQGDDFGSGPTPWKPSTTSFGTPSFDSKGSVSTPRARTEFKTGLTPAYKSFQSTRHDEEPRPIHTQSSKYMLV